jgi:hypothetical protein
VRDESGEGDLVFDRRPGGLAGHVKKTLLSSWRVEADERCHIAIRYGGGFGCGRASRIAQGEKITIQSQYKFGSAGGAKVGAGAFEASIGASREITESIGYELTVTEETSYTSRPCEFCWPRLHFRNARITQWVRRPLHLPLFVTRKTVFDPGTGYELQNHCRHAPEICRDCEQTAPPAGRGGVARGDGAVGVSYLERVVTIDRTRSADRTPKDTLAEIVSTPDDDAPATQLFLPDLHGHLRAVGSHDEHHLLYSLDETDRALGAVRLFPGVNRLLFLRGVRIPGSPTTSEGGLTLVDATSGSIEATGTIVGSAEAGGFKLVEVELTYQPPALLPEGKRLRLVLRRGVIESTWPVLIVQ